MNRSFFLFCTLIVCISSCTSTQPVTTVQYKDYRIERSVRSDTAIVSLLAPYGAALNESMNKVIGFSNNQLSAKQPESGLGNFMADCMRIMAEKKFGRKVDAGFMNQGGIRSYIPKGNITVGRIFELMPFDNLLVLQEVKGAVLQQFLDKMASDGGWPVSAGLTMGIQDKKAVNVQINGKPLDIAAVYVIANSDYVANGGSDCEMLRRIPQQNKGYLMRDALIDFVSDLTRQGKPLDYHIENRVVHVN
ncbi:MAG: 5'-nucleotidase C-terminal domain-containing protein [Chitinophagaceae bacterium]|nr:5'-nucleotidase C-terminal domain-containing protein [Chitinophagaceae bacterium]MCA6453457.1 5'-nucleotidase C-terminal domain-containing protein [Chitinophagaceae bacterium]MCA6455174.1 5'-nucleotidase C-terminal domain-containing protein [Chitinophagaceae bacterium]MCA6459559.1 5'-nucleotidase C-terminal domain-containing protein [Chitinophagaceae bacterium]MCA6464426.1 5'-nucleotidase C-terminal domain-containing protein [Chitinophagaceae bacterium]